MRHTNDRKLQNKEIRREGKENHWFDLKPSLYIYGFSLIRSYMA